MPLLQEGWTPLGPVCGLRGQVGYLTYGESIVGGRVTALAVDPPGGPDEPYRVYAGTTNGGVWASLDGGLSWNPQTDDRVSLSVGAMVVDPTTHKLYVAPGEANDTANIYKGYGLLICDPEAAGGGTWTVRPHARLAWVRSSAIIVEHRPPDRLLYVGTDDGLFVSDDEGVSWTEVMVDPSSAGLRVTDIAFVPGPSPADATMYVALHGLGVWKRIGHAGQFTKKDTGLPAPGPFRRIAVAASSQDADHVVMAIADAASGVVGVFHTQNGGDLWTASPAFNPAPKQTNYNLDVAVNRADPQMMFFAEARLWRSTDHGASWSIVSNPSTLGPGIHADQHAVLVDPGNPGRVWAGNDGGVWVSDDSGLTWHPRNRGLQNFLFYAFAHDPDVESVGLAGSQDNGTLRFEGHPAWRSVRGGDGFFVAIDPADKQFWYSSYCFSLSGIHPFFRSDRRGERGSFESKVRGITDPFPRGEAPFYVPFALDPQNPQVAYLGTNFLYRTGTRGESGWEEIKIQKADGSTEVFDTTPTRTTAINAICVHPNDSTIVFAGTEDGQLWKFTQLNGAVWEAKQAIGLPGVSIADIAIPALPAGSAPSPVVYVGIGTPPGTFNGIKPTPVAAGRFFRSDDGGVVFVARADANLDLSIDGVSIPHTDNAVNAVCVDPDHPQHVYIGCDRGVFFSPDQGNTWQAFSDNLPWTAVYDLHVHAGARLLRAATYGRGVWERPLGEPTASLEGVDLYLRDNALDIGRRSTSPEPGVDPLDPSRPQWWYSGADVKVDTHAWIGNDYQTPSSTETYQPDGPADLIAFENLTHEYIREMFTSRIYAQISNRGPAAATAVTVRAFWAERTGPAYPDLPADFWEAFPGQDPADVTIWKPLDVKSIPVVRPGEPVVVSWAEDFPFGLADHVGILVAATCDDDPIGDPGVDVKAAVRSNKRVVLRETEVSAPVGEIVLVALIAVGVIGLGALGIAAATS
jgi:photosystem II stability/assembly factor-like uncharacterized protein